MRAGGPTDALASSLTRERGAPTGTGSHAEADTGYQSSRYQDWYGVEQKPLLVAL